MDNVGEWKRRVAGMLAKYLAIREYLSRSGEAHKSVRCGGFDFDIVLLGMVVVVIGRTAMGLTILPLVLDIREVVDRVCIVMAADSGGGGGGLVFIFRNLEYE